MDSNPKLYFALIRGNFEELKRCIITCSELELALEIAMLKGDVDQPSQSIDDFNYSSDDGYTSQKYYPENGEMRWDECIEYLTILLKFN